MTDGQQDNQKSTNENAEEAKTSTPKPATTVDLNNLTEASIIKKLEVFILKYIVYYLVQLFYEKNLCSIIIFLFCKLLFLFLQLIKIFYYTFYNRYFCLFSNRNCLFLSDPCNEWKFSRM